jgi:nucleotide-binding universal stress UspA family protein
MVQRILVTLDGSQPAEAALSYAEALARQDGDTLYLLRAAPPDDHAAAGRYLDRLAGDSRARGLAVETLVLDGSPADAVVTAAARDGADLIVMATHGRTGLERTRHGSVADEVLHRTPTPLLLVRLGHVPPLAWPRRVLVPLDGSELAAAALDHVGSLLPNDAELVLYQAVLPEAWGVRGELGDEPVWVGLLSDAEGEARAYLDEVAAQQRAAGRCVSTVAEFGQPAAGITDFCHREHVDLIVLSSHGRGGMPRWLLGSVADDLLRMAPAPLLVLRPRLATAAAPRPRALPQTEPRTRSEPIPTLDLTAHEIALLRQAVAHVREEATGTDPLVAELQTLEQRLPMTATVLRVDARAEAPPVPTTAGPEDRGLAVDGRTIQPGYPVFARHVDPASDFDLGQFVGVVDEVIETRGAPYLHVRGGLEQARELFLPLGAVRAAEGHQVRLNLTTADLLGQTWHTPPRVLQAV